MRLQYDNILLDIARIGSPQFRRVCVRMHARWHKQGRRLNKKAAATTATQNLRKSYLLSILKHRE